MYTEREFFYDAVVLSVIHFDAKPAVAAFAGTASKPAVAAQAAWAAANSYRLAYKASNNEMAKSKICYFDLPEADNIFPEGKTLRFSSLDYKLVQKTNKNNGQLFNKLVEISHMDVELES